MKKVARIGRRLVKMEGRANEESRWAFPGIFRSRVNVTRNNIGGQKEFRQ